MTYIQLEGGHLVNLDLMIKIRRHKRERPSWPRWTAIGAEDSTVDLGEHSDEEVSQLAGTTLPASSAVATYIYRLWPGETNAIEDVFFEKLLVIAWFRAPDGLQWQPITTHGLIELGYGNATDSMSVLELPDGKYDIPEDQCFDNLDHAKTELLERRRRYAESAAKRKAAQNVNKQSTAV